MLSVARKIAARVSEHGAWNTMKYALHRVHDRYHEWRLGIHSGIINLPEQLGFDNPACHGHYPTDFYTFRAVMKHVPIRPGKDVFLDYGSGMGRAVIMAATYPLRKVIGVEYPARLNAIAAQNVEQARSRLACQNIELVTADASEFVLTPEVTIIYFFNPFGGEILARVYENIRQSLRESPRRLSVIYFFPRQFEELIGDSDWLTKRGEYWFPAVTNHKYVIYESTQQESTHAH